MLVELFHFFKNTAEEKFVFVRGLFSGLGFFVGRLVIRNRPVGVELVIIVDVQRIFFGPQVPTMSLGLVVSGGGTQVELGPGLDGFVHDVGAVRLAFCVSLFNLILPN
jgi:hypothetical protein